MTAPQGGRTSTTNRSATAHRQELARAAGHRLLCAAGDDLSTGGRRCAASDLADAAALIADLTNLLAARHGDGVRP